MVKLLLTLVAIFTVLCSRTARAVQVGTEEAQQALLTQRTRSKKGGIFKKAVKATKKNVVDPVKNNVIDPVIEYYTWGKADSKDNLEEAFELLKIADQVYYEDVRDVNDYTYKDRVRKNGALAGVFVDSDSNCVVSFRGTKFNSGESIATDLESAANTAVNVNGYRLNQEFVQSYRQIDDALQTLVSAQSCATILCTGHSLGGALAVVAQADGLCPRTVTFAAPRVWKSGCDNAFRNNARRYFMSSGSNYSPMSLIPNASYDPIPSLPSGFSHCAGDHIHLAEYRDFDSKKKYRSEQMDPIDPTTGANFLTHGASNYKRWFRNYL